MSKSNRQSLLSTTMMPLVLIAGVAAGGAFGVIAFCRPAQASSTSSANPEAVTKAEAPANPCAAAKPGNVQTAQAACGACSPCGACGPCSPCGAGNPCSPCGAASPCSPCGAGGACNPCAAAAGPGTECYVERLQEAAAKSGACSPCAPCNPCEAAPCNPCNPCGAAACSPCNPCGAGACAPCSPCAADGEVELKPDEAADLYECMLEDLRDAYARSGNEHAENYLDWPKYSQRPYVSATHGGRYVQNYANGTAEAYGEFEEAGTMPEGSVLAKDSITVSQDGQGQIGPLFLMEKMESGFHEKSDDWRYTLIQPNGHIVGTTQGEGSGNVEFCIACHKAGSQTDSMMFLPQEVRAQP